MVRSVELVYVPQARPAVHLSFPFRQGMTVADVLQQAALQNEYPEVEELTVGIFSVAVSRDCQLKPGDRVELYRPLLTCPKERRRKQAISQRSHA